MFVGEEWEGRDMGDSQLLLFIQMSMTCNNYTDMLLDPTQIVAPDLGSMSIQLHMLSQ